MTSVPALQTRDLARHYGAIRAVDGVSLTIPEGERRAVIGPNGAGKTTLFDLLTGEVAPSSGAVLLRGTDVTGLPTWGLVRRGIVRMYQRSQLFASLSARENVLLSIAAPRGPYRLSPAASPDDLAEARRVLQSVGLGDREDVTPSKLSHGERRQLELAVALARRPSILLLDEPTAGMSNAETTMIVELIGRLDRTLTLLIVEHDMDVVFRVADRITVMHEGRVVADGPPEQLRGDRVVNEVYLGRTVHE